METLRQDAICSLTGPIFLSRGAFCEFIEPRPRHLVIFSQFVHGGLDSSSEAIEGVLRFEGNMCIG